MLRILNRFTLLCFITLNFVMANVAQISGPLRGNPNNPRYFEDGNDKVVYLTGSHTWSNFQDNGNGNPPPVFNWIGYMEWMKTLNYNFTRLWTWEQTRWTSETADTNYWFNPQTPYKRTGPGNAVDGFPKFNLDSLNDAYFQRLRSRVLDAGQCGIYVSIMLFNGWSVSNRGGFHQPFDGCPFRLSNNINGVNGDADGDGDGEETHSLLDAKVNAYQYMYVKKVIDVVNDLDNVLYEISNESPYAGSDAWQNRMIDTIHAYELRKPKQHPVGYTGDWTIANSTLWSSKADWVSPAAGNNGTAYENDPPIGEGDRTKIVITDTDHLWGMGGDRIWAWKSFTRGLNPIFMDGYDGKSYGCGGVNFDSSNATWISFRKNMGYTRTYANRMNLAAMTPQNNLSSTTYCLANPSATGAEYLVYRPSSTGSIVVNLSSTTENLNIEWFNPETGKRISGGTIAGGNTRLFKVPFTGDAVLYVYDTKLQQSQSATFGGSAISDTILQYYPTAILVSHPMTFVINLVQYTLLFIFGFFTIYLMVLTIFALFAKRRTSFLSLHKKKFCVIIPAHNEETSIGRALQSVFNIDYPRDHYDVVVIADNCTDNTAAIVAGTGSVVLERFNTELRGKGFALMWCFDKLLSSGKGYEAYVVIDADSIASENFLTVLNFYLEHGSKVIQTTDNVEPQPGVWSSEMTRIGFILYNYIRALGRTVIHCPTGLHGNGMCFSVDVIKEVPWKAFSLAEDLEYGIQLLLQGYQTDFAPEAVVLVTMPQQSTNAKSQRARWERGRFLVICRYFIPLLRAAVLRRSYKYFDRLIDLMTPTLVTLLIINLGLFFISSLLYLMGINMMEMFTVLWGVVSIVGFSQLFLGLLASGYDRSTYAALLYLPKYVFWKMSIIEKLLRTTSSDELVHTTREKPVLKKIKRFTKK